tara:strand:- start:17 stop:814 length:798 start_codon:yes stop_codon:yes gene_type:complete
MTLTPQQERLNQSYLQHFGRTADHTTPGGASYWLDTHNPQTDADWDEIDRMLAASAEAQSYASDNVVRPGGVRRDSSTYSQGLAGQEYAAHFQPGGALAGLNSADTLNQIAANTVYSPSSSAGDGEAGITAFTEVPGGYFQFADQDVTPNPNLPGGSDSPAQIDTSQFLTQQGLTDWWDALDKSAFTGNQNSGGMNDFMQFMMFMNMMRPQGGGYGGSQYGYGGLNPGGVMSAYNPMDNFQGYMDAFNTLKGGTTTNTGTATATA